MATDIGFDEKGRCWFRSPQYLTDITNACHFEINDHFSLFKLKRFYYLYAKFRFRESYACISRVIKGKYFMEGEEDDGPMPYYGYDRPLIRTFKKIIGVYKTTEEASIALEDVMKARKVKSIYED